MSEGRLVLVDGTALLYRSFFAIPELSNRSGSPTNALYGFVRAMRQLREAWKPSHWALVLDGGLSKDRLALLGEYKAQRPKMPDALRQQVDTVGDYLDAARIAWFRIDGEEADDVIATLATAAAGRIAKTLIATSDKDMYQLVSDTCKVVPLSGPPKEMGSEAVAAKTGVRPRQVVEWLALVGDSVDNIPGVPGVGPKTASKLLAQFGSLNAMYDRLEEAGTPRIREALRAHRDVVFRNVAMVKLRRDLPVDIDWDALGVHEPDTGKLLEFYEAMDFRGLADELRQGGLFGMDGHG